MYNYAAEPYLEHHGILGMKWGIRRYQNKDGTLTEAGKKRVRTDRGEADSKKGSDSSSGTKASGSSSAKKEKELSPEEMAEAKAKAIANGDVDEILKYAGSMTTAELNEANNRVNAMMNLRSKSEVNKPKQESETPAKEMTKEELQANLEKNKALNNVDIKTILKYADKLTPEEISDLGKRVDVFTKASNFKPPKEKTPIEKFTEALNTSKNIMDSVKNAHKSLRELRDEFGAGSKAVADAIEKADKSKSDSGDTKNNGIANRAKEATKNVVKDVIASHNEKKFSKELSNLRDRDKDNKTLAWLKSVSGSDMPAPKPKANFESPFKLNDGDYSVFKSASNNSSSNSSSSGGSIIKSVMSKIGDTSSSSISIPSSSKSSFSGLTSKDSKTGSTTISEINKMFEGVDNLTSNWIKKNQS